MNAQWWYLGIALILVSCGTQSPVAQQMPGVAVQCRMDPGMSDPDDPPMGSTYYNQPRSQAYSGTRFYNQPTSGTVGSVNTGTRYYNEPMTGSVGSTRATTPTIVVGGRRVPVRGGSFILPGGRRYYLPGYQPLPEEDVGSEALRSFTTLPIDPYGELRRQQGLEQLRQLYQQELQKPNPDPQRLTELRAQYQELMNATTIITPGRGN